MSTTIVVLCHQDDSANLTAEIKRWLKIHNDVEFVGDGVSEKREEDIIILETEEDSAPLWLTGKLRQHKAVTDFLLIEDEVDDDDVEEEGEG